MTTFDQPTGALRLIEPYPLIPGASTDTIYPVHTHTPYPLPHFYVMFPLYV